MPPIQLLSTDFDGTILDWGLSVESATPFFDLVGDWQKKGLIWAINTGRSIPQLEDALRDPRFPIQPDYIITQERAVHRRGRDAWEDFGDWNVRCYEAHLRLNAEAAAIYRKLGNHVSRNAGLTLQQTDDFIEGIISRNEAQMDETEAYLLTLQPELPHLSWQRNSIYLRFSHIDYHKGSALIELSRLLGIGRDATFAAGDNYNDLPMLDGLAARWNACPVNAVAAVKVAVQKAGGYIGSEVAGLGIAEALRACPWKIEE